MTLKLKDGFDEFDESDLLELLEPEPIGPYRIELGCLVCDAESPSHVYQLPASDREVVRIANAAYQRGLAASKIIRGRRQK